MKDGLGSIRTGVQGQDCSEFAAARENIMGRVGGKAGRGSKYKVPFVTAVSLNDKGLSKHLLLNLFSGFTSKSVGNWDNANLGVSTLMTSGGLGWFVAVADSWCMHAPMVMGDLKPRDLPGFKWLNAVLGNQVRFVGVHDEATSLG